MIKNLILFSIDILRFIFSPISGEKVLRVQATDADSGINAKLSYRIEKGSYNDFSVDSETGVVKVASKLDFDRRNFYNITVIATDSGGFSIGKYFSMPIYQLNRNLNFISIFFKVHLR